MRSSRSLVKSIALVGSLAVALLASCSRPCASLCTPEGPWQSPSIRSTRALLVVEAPELRILRVDGGNVSPACQRETGVREYYLPPGPHRITASFRYQARVGGGIIGAVEGEPLTLKHQFVAGRAYVAIYREHPLPQPEPEGLFGALRLAFSPRQESYWSMHIVDLTDVGSDADPAIKRAQLYCSLIKVERPIPIVY